MAIIRKPFIVLSVLLILLLLVGNYFTVAMVLLALTLAHIVLTSNHDYWTARGIPGPTPWPFFGTYFWQFFIPFQESEVERYNKYGKIYGIYDGTTPGIIVGRPDLIKDILCGTTALHVFTNRRAVKTTHPVMSKFLSSLEGDEWKRVRSITAPTFSTGTLRSMVPIMNDAAVAMMDVLEDAAAGRKDVELKLLFGNYTMEVIAKSAFATDPDEFFVSQARQLFTFPFWRKFLDYVMPMFLLESVGFTVLPPGPMDFFRKITIAIIKNRRANNIQMRDFLQILINAEDENANVNKKLTEDEILSQAVLFFSVGYETSSQLLTYCSYCLALNPDCQEKLFAEISAVVGKNGGELDYEDIQNIEYLNAVIDESLRLYNPVLRVERRASSDFKLGDTGITIPNGMIVGIPVWSLHHAPEYYPDPYTFKPERFLPHNKTSITPFTYLPFGEGPRKCIGMRYALMECKVALAEILMKFRFVKSPRTKETLGFFTTGRPLLGPEDIFLGIEKREVK